MRLVTTIKIGLFLEHTNVGVDEFSIDEFFELEFIIIKKQLDLLGLDLIIFDTRCLFSSQGLVCIDNDYLWSFDLTSFYGDNVLLTECLNDVLREIYYSRLS